MDFSIKNNYGMCNYGIESDYIHIYNLYVFPEFRKTGRARELLQSTINIIRLTGYMDVILIVAKSNDKSVYIDKLKVFYKEMGLEVYSDYI